MHGQVGWDELGDRRSGRTCQPRPLRQLVSLTNSQANPDEIAKAHHVIRECDLALRRYRAALEQGANPETVGQWINGAAAKRAAAKRRLHELRHHDQAAQLTAIQVRELVRQVGGTVDAFAAAEPAERAGLYQQLGIELIYQPTQRLVVATADLSRHSEGVGGPTGPLGLPGFTTPVAVQRAVDAT